MPNAENVEKSNAKNPVAAKGGIDKSRFTEKLAVNRPKVKTSDKKSKDWTQEFSGVPLLVEQMPPTPNRNTGVLEAWYAATIRLTSTCIVVEEEKERQAIPGEIVIHGVSGHTKRLLRDIARWAREGKTYDVLFEPDGWQQLDDGNDMRVFKYTAAPSTEQKRGTGPVFIGGPEMKEMLMKMGVAVDDPALPVSLHTMTIAQLTAGSEEPRRNESGQ